MRWTALAALVLAACASSATTDTTSTGATPSSPSSEAARTTEAADTTDSVVTNTIDPTAADATTSATSEVVVADVVVPVGFDRTTARITEADGTICEICVWVADTASQRSAGLMFVTDLGDADAMAFVYPRPRTGTFWMKNTLLPLSIAFFAPDGTFISSFDMEPCVTDDCPNYRTADNFLVAVEVPQGELGAVGLVAGSTLELLDLPCTD